MNNTLCAALVVAFACACSPTVQARSSYVVSALLIHTTGGLLLAEADLNAILPGGPVGAAVSQSAAAPSAAPPQPTFEKWDVLHQYPRYLPATPPAEPRTPAAKPQETSKPPKDHQDA